MRHRNRTASPEAKRRSLRSRAGPAIDFESAKNLNTLFRRKPLVAALIVALNGGPAFAAGPAGSMIVTDGRTQTALQVNGTTTNVTTSTIVGNNAFNSFSKFDVYGGNTVNLYIPPTAANLLNLINSSSASRIDGMLNAVKNGQIGGNVFLANPEGVIVGATGVINAGSLTLITPTRAFIDGFFDAPGLPNAAATASLLTGTVPINDKGLIHVKGRINTNGDATLQGGSVINAGAILSGARFSGVQADFSDIVNVNDVTAGNRIAVQNGKIRILAANDIENSGTIASDGANGVNANDIEIRAGHDVKLAQGGLISASGHGERSSGGNILIWANNQLTTQAGTVVRADGGEISGNGGFIDLSARKTLVLSGGALSAHAPHGAAGSILLDPENLVVDNDLLRGDPGANSVGAGPDGIAWDAGNLTLLADDTITVTANHVVSTRQVAVNSGQTARDAHLNNASTGDSGNLTISAKKIVLESGSQLLADASAGHSAGDITLNAVDTADDLFFKSLEDQEASIDIHGATLKGRNIKLNANANDVFEYTPSDIANVFLRQLDNAAYLVDVSISQAKARITLDGSAVVSATGNVDIAASAKAEAAMNVSGELGFGVGYGKATASATAEVLNARIDAGGTLKVSADGNAKTDIAVATINRERDKNPLPVDASQYIDLALALGEGQLDSKAVIAGPSRVSAVGDLSVLASGTKSASVAAKGAAYDDGTAGSGLAFSSFTSNVTAQLDGTVSHAQNVIVSAGLDAPTNSILASSGSGSGLLAEISQAAPSQLLSTAISLAVSGILDVVGFNKPKSPTSSEKFGLAASFLNLDQQNNVLARIGPQARVAAAGKVDVTATATDVITYRSAATVDQAKLGNGSEASSKAKEKALAAAIAVVDLGNHTQAYIGDGAVVDATGAITVSAHSDIPVPYEAWGDWSEVHDFLSGLNKLDSLLGSATFSTITGWTQSFAESDKLGLAGSFNFFTLDNQASAWIGDDARINTNGAAIGAARDVTVSALATQGTINLGGVFGFKLAGVDSQNTGIGGGLVILDFSDGAHASVGRGAIVQGNDILVDARSESDNITIAEAGGKSAKGTAFNASIALVDVNNSTTALVDGSAVISSTGTLSIHATDETRTITAAGGFSKGENAVGLAIAVNDVERETRAGVFSTVAVPPAILSLAGAQVGTNGTLTLAPGAVAVAGQAVIFDAASGSGISGLTDNAVYYVIVPDPEHPNVIQLGISPVGALNGEAVTGLGTAHGPALTLSPVGALGSGGAMTVTAHSDGVLDAVAVAGSLAQDGKEPAPVAGESASQRMDKLAAFGAKAEGRHGIAFSGDASVNTVNDVTEAGLTDVRLVGAPSLVVTATNASEVLSVAGAVAISTAKGKVPGIAGSYSENDMTNVTRAFVRGSTVDVDGALTISASTADSTIEAWTAGVAVATRYSAVVGSVSINSIANVTSAFIDGQSDVSSGSALVNAVDGASIFALAGSLDYAGDKGIGLGASVAINDIGNTTDAHVAQSDLKATAGGVTISQQADQDIRSIAISAGASTGGLAANFAVSLNTIESTDTAYVSGKLSDGIQGKAGVAVSAADDSSILAVGGGLAVSTKAAGVGGSGAYSLIDNEVSAYLVNTQVKSDSGSVSVVATADDTISTTGIGFGGGKSVGIAGSVAVNRIDTTTQAYLDNADVVAYGSVAVVADADYEFDTYGGSLAIGGSAGIGGTVGVNLLYGDTQAYISGGSKVDAAGNVTVEVPAQDADGKRDARGVAVFARTVQHAESWLVSAAFSGNFGIGLTGTGSEATSETLAYIAGDAEINGRHQDTANAGQSVSVEAFSDTRYVSWLGTLAGSGSTAVGATAAVGLMSTATRAYIDNAEVSGKDDVTVLANSKESLEAKAATAGIAGDVALAGTVFVTRINGLTDAHISNSDTIVAGGDLTVRAQDLVEIGRNDTSGLLGGAVAFSGAAAVGAAVSTVSIGNTTRAYMTDVKSDALGSTRVQAVSSQELHSGLLGFTIAGGLNISASVLVTDIAARTEAYISQTVAGATVINGHNTGAAATQDVEVSADSTTSVTSNIFSAGGAVASGGASVDVTSIRNDVSAVIGDGVEVHAKHDVDVEVNSRHTVDSLVVAFGGGVGVAQGAVSIVTIGSSMSDNASQQSADAQSTSSGQSADAQAMMGFEGQGTYQPDGAMFGSSVAPGGTTAKIGSGAKIIADNDISVSAANSIEVDLTPGAGTAGVGTIGAGIGIANLKPRVLATVGANAELKAGADIAVSADASIFGSKVDAYAAGVGAAVISAAVAIIDSDANVEASLGDSVKVTDADSVTVHAGRFNEQRTEAWGLSLGAAGAIGASVAESNSSGTTKAYVGNFADLSKVGSLNINAGNTVGSSYGNSAFAVAGAGGGLVGASGAEARAISSGDIYATTGAEVKLPAGDVVLSATRQSHQEAETLGVTAGGYLAIGVTISRSESSGLTKAELGTNTVTGDDREGDLLVAAISSDNNHAKSVAGSGGAVAGNGAEASTTDDSDVYAGIAASSASAPALHGGAVRLQALHVSSYAGEADSVNAALIGASGSNVKNNLTADAQANIGAGVHIVASDAIAAGARNEFYSAVGGDSATGAAGGVLSGSAAISSTAITSRTTTELGAGVDLESGTDPMSRPGGILLDASTIILASDRVQLTTGGAIAGAGTNSSIDATVSNNVRIGIGAELDSQGNIAAGTYTLANMRSESRASTWGLAGVGVALARTTANIAENVSVGASSDITAFGNVNLMAGDDPSGIYDSTIVGNADALAYVRGLIAVPLAYADSVLTSNAMLDIGAGAKINSAQNVTIGAYNGALNPITNGEGHGFQLGFIPTENGNQGDGPRKVHTASLVNNGDVTAGYYHTLNITIPECATGSLSCAVNVDPGGAPFDWSYERFFNAPAFINTHFGGAAAALIASGASSTPVGAITLGTLFASGGNVTVNADSISGTGSITAHGAPTITVTNDSANYLILGNVLIPNTPGGRVQFTGAAGEAQAGGITMHQEPNQQGVITIHNTFAAPVGNSMFGPALFLTGNIENIAGNVVITNDTGSLGQTGTIFGKEVHVTVPEGVAVIDIPNGTYYAGGTPYSEWQDFWFWPDDTPGNVTPNANGLFTYIFGAGTFEQAPRNGANKYFIYADCRGGDCFMSSISPVKQFSIAGNYNSADLSGSQKSSAIYGGRVLIKAKYIDINGGITIGTDTDWSINLNSDLMSPVFRVGNTLLGGEIALADYRYDNKLVSNPIVELRNVTASNGDSLIGVKYDAQNKRILLNDVKASSDGGTLVLDGKIISTNGLGNIHVNGGLGDVEINNQTGRQVVVQDIYAGNPGATQTVVSTVDITDRNFADATNHWVYQYKPQQGLSIYNGDATSSVDVGNMTLVSSGGSNAVQYRPMEGLRWLWQEVATMRNAPPIIPPGGNVSLENWGNVLTCCTWSYEMPVGQPNNPWQYVAWTDNGAAAGLTNTPTGKLVSDPAQTAAFTRTIRSEVTQTWDFWTNSSGSQNFFFDNAQAHTLFYPTQVKFTQTSSVKADNPISIDFSGSPVSRVAINSVGNVSLTGVITNPAGATTINTGGSVSQSGGASIQTDSLVITATAGIGSRLQPIVNRLSPNGLVKAMGGIEGIFLDLQGGRIQEVVAKKTGVEQYGDVEIRSLDDLLPQAGGTRSIIGANVTLTSTLGSVGSETDPIRMSAMGASGQGGAVNATALNDIHLVDTAAHNFLVGQIASIADGDISIQVPNGSIVNASEQTSAQALSQDQVQQVWKDLKLIKGAAIAADSAEVRGSATAHSVVAFQNAITSQVDQYRALSGDGTVVNGTFVLSTDPVVVAKYQAQATASGTTVQEYAASKYKTLTKSFEDNIGADWQSQLQQQDYRFAASQAQINALTHDSGWTAEELNYSVSDVALQARSAPVGAGTANIIGHNVKLVAGGSIGKLADPVDIALESLADGSLSIEQKAALALAKAPGDVVRLGKDAQGVFVTYQLSKLPNGNTDYDSIPAGVTPYGFRIAQTSPLFIDVTGSLNASAGDAAFVQAVRPTLVIDQVHAGGSVGLVAPEDIVAAAVRSLAGTPLISAGTDLRLTAGTGSLGRKDAPLTLQVGGHLVSASAGQDAYLTSEGNLTFDRIFAERQVVLKADGGSLLAGAEGVTIDARGIHLVADGDIGARQSAIVVQIADNDFLTATAGGNAALRGAGTLMHVASLSAGGDAQVSADGDLQADHVSSAGSAIIGSAGNMLVATLESGGAVEFESGGSIQIGAVKSGGAATLSARGSILSTGFSGINIAARDITLSSDTADIGAATKRLVVEDHGITNATAFGNLSLEQRNANLQATELASLKGSVDLLVSGANATIGTITALNAVNVRLTTGGRLMIDNLDPVSANLAVSGAGGSIEVRKARVSNSLSASASSVALDEVTQGPASGPLHFTLQGAGGGVADFVNARILSANGVVIDRLAARNALIDANVANLWIENASIGSLGIFDNAFYTAYLDNVGKVRHDGDLQLYAPFPFYLRFFAEPRFETNALPIDYGDNFTVNGVGPENAATRFVPRLLSLSMDGMPQDKVLQGVNVPARGLVSFSSESLVPDDAIVNIEQLQVNSR